MKIIIITTTKVTFKVLIKSNYNNHNQNQKAKAHTCSVEILAQVF